MSVAIMTSLIRRGGPRRAWLPLWTHVRWNDGNRVIDEALTPAEYNVRFKEYKKEMRSFRGRIKKERADAKAKEEEQKRISLGENPLTDAELKKEKERQYFLRQFRSQERMDRIQEEKKPITEAAFHREATRRKLIKRAEEERYAVLLEQSRRWITEETLDDRIRRALDHVKTLY